VASDQESYVFHQRKGYKNNKIAYLFSRIESHRAILEEHQELAGNQNLVKLGRLEKIFVFGNKKNFFNTENIPLLMLYTIVNEQLYLASNKIRLSCLQDTKVLLL
jgi:hypothetical protein